MFVVSFYNCFWWYSNIQRHPTRGVMSGNITFILCVGSQWWNKTKVNIDYHTVVNHCLQYSNSVYVSLVVTCFSVLMVKYAWYLVSILLYNILRRVPLVRSPSIFSFICMFCRTLFVLLHFFFWSLCCLFFFDIRILIALLVSSNSS
jgi:hypothetical protein